VNGLPPGTVLGRYRIEQLLGRGGMGDVYRAEDTVLRRRVALKVLRPDPTTPSSGAEDARRRLLREARAAAAFDHPNVVHIFDVGEDQGFAFIAMQLVEGVPLRAYVGRPDPPLEQRISWLAGIARALAAAHRAGLVHRDVKPDNVMVCADGVKVLDFGIAKVAPDAPSHSIIYSTQPGQWVGTPRYMAPEQRLGHADPRSDQYAWALVAYELLGGTLPTISGAPLQPLPQVAPVPPELWAIIARAAAEDPGRRFGSMDEVLAALAPFGGAATGGGVVAAPVRTGPPPSQAAPTPLSAYSTVPSRVPPPPPSGLSAPHASFPPHGMMHPTGGAPTLASPGEKRGSGLVVAIVVALIGVLALGGVAIAAFFVLHSPETRADGAPDAGAVATPSTTTSTTPTSTPTANAGTNTSPTGAATSRAVHPVVSDAGASPMVDAGAPVADAGARGKDAGVGRRVAFVYGNDPPFEESRTRAKAMQPSIQRCVDSNPPPADLRSFSVTVFIHDWDGSVYRVSMVDSIGAGLVSCLDPVFRSQVYPAKAGKLTASFQVSLN
jgi:serine/threonine protein kinase